MRSAWLSEEGTDGCGRKEFEKRKVRRLVKNARRNVNKRLEIRAWRWRRAVWWRRIELIRNTKSRRKLRCGIPEGAFCDLETDGQLMVGEERPMRIANDRKKEIKERENETERESNYERKNKAHQRFVGHSVNGQHWSHFLSVSMCSQSCPLSSRLSSVMYLWRVMTVVGTYCQRRSSYTIPWWTVDAKSSWWGRFVMAGHARQTTDDCKLLPIRNLSGELAESWATPTG